MKINISLICLQLMGSIVVGVSHSAAAESGTDSSAGIHSVNSASPTIFIAGDSTAASYTTGPKQGWGAPFADYVDNAKLNVANRARGGLSSRTFITAGHWEQMLAEIKAGDYVLIQFGHNDAGAINEEPPSSTKPLRARGTLPGIGDETEDIVNVFTKKPETVHTFGWYIRRMITETRARGATPIVLSLTARNVWQDGRVERGFGRYREWDRAVAVATKTDFVDLTQILADRYAQLGEPKVRELFAPADDTHTNSAGADFNAAAVVAGLKGLRDGPFAKYLSAKGAAVEPDRIGWLNLPEPANAALPTLMLIGDSTVRNGNDQGANGQWGWGLPLADYFDPSKVNFINRAIGGQSSRTFITQGNWARALALLKRGDVLVMQFGHNDSSPVNDDSRARGTLNGIGEETELIDNLLTKEREIVHTYGWYLRKMINDAKMAGVSVVVCSLIPRKHWQDGRIKRSGGDSYGGWAQRVAADEQVAFVDLNTLIGDRYDAMGEEKVNALFADANSHTNLDGAKFNAAVVAEALRALPKLHQLFRGE